MLLKRYLIQNVPRCVKLCSENQEIRFKSKISMQRCQIRNICGMKLILSNSDYRILTNPQHCYLSYSYPPLHLKRNDFTRPKKEEIFKSKDEVPSDYDLIYKAPMENYFVYGQRITSLGILVVVGLGLNELCYLYLPRDGFTFSLVQSYTEFIALYLGLTCTVLFLHLSLNKFAVRMYHNPSSDTYIAIFMNSLGLVSKMDFSKDQIEKVNSLWPTPWKRNLYSIKSKSVILNEIHFRLPADYNALLKFEKET